MAYSPPPLFDRGPAPVVRLAFFTVAAIVLMVLDARFRYAEVVRQAFVLAVYPLQRAAVAPFTIAEQVGGYFVAQTTLLRESAQMREERLRAAQDLVRLQSLLDENQRLRELMSARARVGVTSQFAEVLYLGRDPFSRKVIIDQGSQHGIEAGQPVMDWRGLVGQVTRVHPLLAEVSLIIDKEQSIPVQVQRTGLRGVASGSGDGSTIELRFMAANTDVDVGDLLVTSGLDAVYPAGLPVARITRIDKDTAFSFARVIATPVGGAGVSRELLVLAKAHVGPPWPIEDPAAAQPKRPQRGQRKAK